MTRTYEIDPAINVAATIAKANKVAARAAAKGLIGGYTITTTQATKQTQFGQVTRTYLVIDGEPAQYGGWTFVAKVEYVNGQPVVTGSPFYTGPQVDRSTLKTNWCDECGKKIARTKTIVVEDQDGKRVQVGTACVKDFLGQEVTAAFYSTKDPLDEFDGYAGGGAATYLIDSVASVAACIIRQAGFTSKAAAGFDSIATSSLVSRYVGESTTKDFIETQARFGTVTDGDRATAQAAIEFGKALTGDTDYALNVKAVLSDDYAAAKFIALITSVVGIYVRQQAEAKVVEAEVKAPAPQGKATVTGTVVAIKVQDTQWGTSVKFTVKADEGFSVWSTIPASIVDEVEIGDRVEFTATLTPSDRDESFAFATRPTKASVKAA